MTLSGPRAALSLVPPAASAVAPLEVRFAHGLVGCPDWREFVLRERDDLPGIWTLELLGADARAFTLLDVRDAEPAFFERLSADDAAALAAYGVGAHDDVRVFCTLTFHARGALSANLLGPLVIDLRHATGAQLVLASSPWTTRHPVAAGGE